MPAHGTRACDTLPSMQQVPAPLARAGTTDEEWKALGTAAIQAESSVPAIVASLISDYLWANGYIERERERERERETEGEAVDEHRDS